MNHVHRQHHNHHRSTDDQAHDKHAGHSPEMFKNKFWLSLILTIPIILYSPAVISWINYEPPIFADNKWLPTILGIIIFFYGGLVFLKSAKTEIANKQPGMMTLISMAISVAFAYSLTVSLGLVSGMDFWWELATLITIMLLGHWLEMSSISSAQGALKELAKLLPDEAELVTSSGNRKVLVSDLSVGDKVLVRPGSNVPVDGVVIKGYSDVNESMLTGESLSVGKNIMSQVIAGTLNGSGSLTVRVTKVGDNTALAGIMKLVSDAQNSKSKTQILADRAAFYLTFIAIGSAILTVVGWLLLSNQSVEFIIERTVTVLIIACPHALGLAIPLVATISTSKAAKQGILVRNRIALESARNIDIVLFDKTGTLTKGEQGVIDIVALNGNENEILMLAASVESESEHPISRAIVKSAKSKRIKLKDAKDFESLAGRGVKATVDGRAISVGGPQLLRKLRINLPYDLQNISEKAGNEGKTVVYIVDKGKINGLIMLADVIRVESKEAVSSLQRRGIRVALLTGDARSVASWVANELNITEFYAEVLPHEKATAVSKLQSDGSRVAVVGDGVNDAPALAQADVGIAIGAGTDVAIESAGVILAGSDPRSVLKVMKLSRATYHKMLQNLAWAVGYNVLAIPLAAGALYNVDVVLEPAVGAVLMSVSTIVVAMNAQLLRRYQI